MTCPPKHTKRSSHNSSLFLEEVFAASTENDIKLNIKARIAKYSVSYEKNT